MPAYLLGASGAAIHLHNTAVVPYTGSGTPWTSASTTPFRIAANDLSGPKFTPTAAEPQNVYVGGPPFADGQALADGGMGNVVETIAIEAYASTIDYKIALAQLLRIELAGLLALGPATFVYQPLTSSQPVAYRVVGARVQELPGFINEEARTNLARLTLYLTRHPKGGRLGGGVAAFGTNPATFQNTGTGATNDLVAFSTLVGEDQYAGQPLNLRLSMPSSSVNPISTVYLASAYSRQYVSSGASATTSGSTLLATVSGLNVTNALTRDGLKARLVLRLSAFNSNAQLAAYYKITTAMGVFVFSVTPYFNANTGYIDLGDVPIDALRDAYASGVTTGNVTIDCDITLRSLSGSVTVGISYAELVLYWDWAIIDNGPGNDGTNKSDLLITSFPVRSTLAAVSLPAPVVSYVLATGSGVPIMATGAPLKGSAPRAFQGGSLYVAWQPGTAYSSSQQLQVTGTYAPVYHTLRGNA